VIFSWDECPVFLGHTIFVHAMSSFYFFHSAAIQCLPKNIREGDSISEDVKRDGDLDIVLTTSGRELCRISPGPSFYQRSCGSQCQ
jgi:hypothetical protein